MRTSALRLTAITAVGLLCGLYAVQADDNYYHASTPAESYARGMSDFVRAAGDANLRNSEAAINYEQARSMELDNRLQYTQTYFENRRLNREYRAAGRGPRPTTEQMFRMARMGMPARMASSDVDHLSGEISWPDVLQGDKYASYRKAIEPLFRERASKRSKLSGDEYLTAKKTSANLLEALKENIKDIPPQDYSKARNFLTNLSYEVGQPPL